jgi:2-dehydropantoate 2-reductase
MGCLFGARLSSHADVTLIGHWPEQLEALRRAPLRLIYPDGGEESVKLRATDHPETVSGVDTALILTKSAQTEAAAQGAVHLLKPDGLAITLQNGVGNHDILSRIVGPDRAVLGVTMQGASTGGRAGVLRYGGTGRTVLATYPAVDSRVRAVAALFQQAGLETEVVEDVARLVWEKLAINAAINPLTALLRVPNGALVETEWAPRLMRRVVSEVAAVAAAQHILLPFEEAAARVEQVAHLTAHNHSSMLQDVLRGAETEIEVICGAVVRIGETLGIDTPANRTLYELIKVLEETDSARLLP